MKLEKMPSEFQEALPVLEKIKESHFEAYFVGGSVRDVLLNRPIHDVDIATSSYPEETKTIFPRTVDVGVEHGTVLVLENKKAYEITTFRTEDVYVDYRRPSQVSFVRSLKEDLKRRDFTINALALDETGQIIDLFQGLNDIDHHILRAVGVPSERFNEDALRIMRGFRFQATLGFTIEEKTFEAMKNCVPLLTKISIERIFIEFDKLLTAPFWRQGLETLIRSQAINYLPDMENCQTKLEKLFQLEDNFRFSSSEQAWAALLLELEISDVRTFLNKWKCSKTFSKKVAELVEISIIREDRKLTKRDCYRYDLDLLRKAEELRKAKNLSVDFISIEKLYASLTIYNKHEIKMNGSMLMKTFAFKPGPTLGKILSEIEWAIVDGKLENTVESIKAFVEERL